MRDIIFKELIECNRAVKKMPKKARKKGNRALCKTIEKMHELSSIAKNEGLLPLEEKIDELKSKKYPYLKSILKLIVDYPNIKAIEEICTARYFSMDLKKYDALNYLIIMVGSLSILGAENPYIIEKKLLSFVPEDVEILYRKSCKKKKSLKKNREYEVKRDLEKSVPGLKIDDVLLCKSKETRKGKRKGKQKLSKDDYMKMMSDTVNKAQDYQKELHGIIKKLDEENEVMTQVIIDHRLATETLEKMDAAKKYKDMKNGEYKEPVNEPTSMQSENQALNKNESSSEENVSFEEKIESVKKKKF